MTFKGKSEQNRFLLTGGTNLNGDLKVEKAHYSFLADQHRTQEILQVFLRQKKINTLLKIMKW